jgi:hypothetical protein
LSAGTTYYTSIAGDGPALVLSGAADDGRLEIAASAAAAAGSHNHRDQVTAAHLDGH